MEFLNLPALYALGALPVLLIPYLVRRKPRLYVFSSLLCLASFATRPQRRSWGRLRLPLLFVLQFLLLALLVGAAGEPVLSRRSGGRLAVVLDNSASMQAMADGASRFDLAKQEAARILGRAPAGVRVDLYLTAPWAGLVGENLAVGEALALLREAKAYDLGDAKLDYGDFFDRLVQQRGYERLYFLTDRPVRGAGGAVRAISVGQARGNVAITGFEIARGGLGSGGPSARVEIANFSSTEKAVTVVLLGDGRHLASKPRRLPAGQSTEVAFENMPGAAYYEARVRMEGETMDPLALDNRRFAVAARGDAAKTLGISPRAKLVESLRAVSGLELDLVDPAAYEKIPNRKYGLEIFHLAAPQALPRNNTLFILPPDENPVASFGAPVADAVVSGWDDAHSLTRYVNFSMLRPRYSRPLEAKVPAHSILESPGGSLAVVFERNGYRYAVLGFDPLPFLGRRHLPMSIFTLNLLGWLQDGTTSVNQFTGDPLKLAHDVRRDTLTPTREGPADAPAEDRAPVLFQGVYERSRNQQRELVAVNFDAPTESDLLDPSPVVLKETRNQAGGGSGYGSLWPFVVAIGLFLVALEWLLNPPEERPRSPQLVRSSLHARTPPAG